MRTFQCYFVLVRCLRIFFFSILDTNLLRNANINVRLLYRLFQTLSFMTAMSPTYHRYSTDTIPTAVSADCWQVHRPTLSVDTQPILSADTRPTVYWPTVGHGWLKWTWSSLFTLAIFAAILVAIFAAISWRFQIACVNYWRFCSDLSCQ